MMPGDLATAPVLPNQALQADERRDAQLGTSTHYEDAISMVALTIAIGFAFAACRQCR
jgi:hypothetical protein